MAKEFVFKFDDRTFVAKENPGFTVGQFLEFVLTWHVVFTNTTSNETFEYLNMSHYDLNEITDFIFFAETLRAEFPNDYGAFQDSLEKIQNILVDCPENCWPIPVNKLKANALDRQYSRPSLN